MAGIEAAAHPAHVPYLYYVAGADGCGELVFSVGYSRFLANAAAYERALARNGGKVPTCTR
jgi:cell division protein YceG involved in septum cleavage